MRGICLDKRVLGGLAIVGVGLLVVAPNLLVTALPLLLLAACPLSMLFMAKGMIGGGQRATVGQPNATVGVATSYVCPMHREVSADGPRRCPTCGMALVPSSAAIAAPDRTGSALEPAEQIALLRLQLQRVGEQQAVLARQLAHLQSPAAAPAPKADDDAAVQVNRGAAARV